MDEYIIAHNGQGNATDVHIKLPKSFPPATIPGQPGAVKPALMKHAIARGWAECIVPVPTDTQKLGPIIYTGTIEWPRFEYTLVDKTQEDYDAEAAAAEAAAEAEFVRKYNECDQWVDEYLETVPTERRYRDMQTLTARYTNSKNPKFAAEAKAGQDLCADVWAYVEVQFYDIVNGIRDFPETKEELWAELPKINWPA